MGVYNSSHYMNCDILFDELFELRTDNVAYESAFGISYVMCCFEFGFGFGCAFILGDFAVEVGCVFLAVQNSFILVLSVSIRFQVPLESKIGFG